MFQANRQPQPTRCLTTALRAVALAVALAAQAGCQSGPLAVWRTASDKYMAKGPTDTELGDDRSLISRWLTPKSAPHSDPTKTTPLVKGPGGWEIPKVAPNPEADAEYQTAEKLFQQGQFEEAETAFAAIAKKHKGTPWGEKGQFYLAETEFQRGRFARAHDNFEKLAADYTGTIYMDKLVAREYQIAQIWFGLYDPKVEGRRDIPWTGRFDGSRPLLDTNGYARQVLEHVRMHDPQGPLADDAVLKLADDHMKLADYETAAIYYDQLISDYPKSPFIQRAQLASIDARMKGYIGPEYDGAGLVKARELIKQTMTMFPDRPEGNEKLYHTLDLINDQDAERTYRVGDYYRRIGKVVSAEYYFGKIPQRWPKSPWAVKAKTELASLAKMPREPSLPSKIMTQPANIDPFTASQGPMGAMGGMGGMGMGGMGMPGGMM